MEQFEKRGVSGTVLKNHLMYQNSNKKYRQSVQQQRTQINFFSILDVLGQLVMFGEGYNAQ